MKLELTPEDLEIIKQALVLVSLISGWTVASTAAFLKALAMVYKQDLHNAVKMAISVLTGVLITLALHIYFGLLNSPVESIVVGLIAGLIGTGGVSLALHVSKPLKAETHILEFAEEEKLEPYPV